MGFEHHTAQWPSLNGGLGGRLSPREMATTLVITQGKKKGRHPSPANMAWLPFIGTSGLGMFIVLQHLAERRHVGMRLQR
jgi:hypothetical protein